MSYKHLSACDTAENMIARLKNFDQYLPRIECAYEQVCVRPINFFEHVVYHNKVQRPTYTNVQCIDLAEQLNIFATACEEILKGARHASGYKKLDTELRKVLIQTYDTILSPTQKNCDDLNKLAKSVNGKGDVWGKVGFVLGTIVLFLLGILPGLIFLVNSHTAMWQNNSPKGLSLLANNMRQTIKDTGQPESISGYGFFNPLKDKFAAAVDDLTATDVKEQKLVS